MNYGRFLGIGAICAGMILAGCLGGGSGSSSSEAGTRTGRVAVLMTDAPVAADTFAHIWITVTGVTLLGDDETKPVTLFEGEETIDLLNLTNHSELFALTDVPAGDYEKIRLTVSEIELVKVTGENTTESFFPHLPGNGKIDLNPRGTLHVAADATVIVQIDVDAGKSIHIVRKGNKDEYNFRPVIFVNIITDAYPGKLVRHSGYIRDLNTVPGTFELCDMPLALSDADDDCLDVTTANASVFTSDGAPALTGALENDQRVTAIGFLGVTPMPLNTLVSLTTLHAEVIGIGGPEAWNTYRGAVGTAPAGALAPFTVLPDGATMLTAQLQTGTKVFARDGTRLDHTDIVMGTDVAVDGVPDSVDATRVKASLVVVDTHDALDHIAGTVKTIDYVARTLVIMTASGDVTVHADDDTLVFLISKTGDAVTNEEVAFGKIGVNDAVTVYGRTQNDASVAAKVVVIDATLQ